MNYVVRDSVPEEVQKELKPYPELLQQLLYYRGIETEEAAEEFLNPDYKTHLHDPYLIKDMDKVVKRIIQAVKNEEKTVIYSDYDADGIPGAVVLHDFFKKIGYKNFTNYIPHRHNEGFGLNDDAIQKFIEDEVKLLITIDCGISDVAEIKKAADAGIDVIITDHHLPQAEIPPAFAILNSKQDGCEYPYKMLCGAGVIFKLVQALVQRKAFDFKEGQEKWLLDMVGLATLSDMVPLKGENRVLAYYGMKVLKKSPRPGLLKLLSRVNINPKYLTEDDLAFMVTPRINAASRMGIPMDAFSLLSTQDEKEADRLALHLEEINNERKGIVASMVKDMKKHLVDRELGPVIVIGNPDWKPSLLGLAANSLVEAFNRPAFLWGREGGDLIKGSCRSDGSLSVMELMTNIKDQFIDFGGHDMSGGFSVSPEKIHHLEEKLIEAATMLASDTREEKKVMIDKKISLDDVNAMTWKHLERLAPFGIENHKPLFLFERVIPNDIRTFGKGNDHLELSFSNSRNHTVRAIGFFMKPEDFPVKPYKDRTLDLVATIEKSMFRNRPEIRLRIVDII